MLLIDIYLSELEVDLFNIDIKVDHTPLVRVTLVGQY